MDKAWTDPGRRNRGLLLLQAGPQLLRGEQAEGEDVSVFTRRQHKVVIVAAANVSQVSVLVVVNTEGPVVLHGREALVLQQVDPDGA